MGLGKGAAAILPFAILGGVLKWADWQPFAPSWLADPASGPEVEEETLFSHSKGELHCMDRELKHPCVNELREYIDANTTEAKTIALDCVHGVLQTNNDFYVLKNMTHLLLDLDTVVHVFDKGSRDNEFIRAGLDYAKKLMKHPECLGDFDTKSHLQCRCVPLFTKISMLKMKNSNRLEDAKKMYDEAKQLSWSGAKNSYGPGEAIAWDSPYHTPQIWIPGLRSQVVWPRETWGDLPICGNLEKHFSTIQEETARALSNEVESGFEDAYRFLYEKGEWNQVLLYHGRKFTRECESVFPKTCALLKQWLPSKPGIPWVSDQQEQVMIIKMKKGTDVETHSGPANNILNIHIGISGLKGARLTVAGQQYKWEMGKVIAWDGSYDHRVDCLECEADERVIMMVRYMHPDMTPEHFKGVSKTHFEDVPAELQ